MHVEVVLIAYFVINLEMIVIISRQYIDALFTAKGF